MYEDVIRKLKEKYTFVDFFQNKYSNGDLILRHDIDFCLESAYQMASLEKESSVKSTYFFMTNSAAYNVFDKEYCDKIDFIAENHHVGLHFNPDNNYVDIGSLYEFQLNVLSLRFPGIKLFTSVHRPSGVVLNNPELPFNHSYHPDYFTKIGYFSDSRCNKDLHGLFSSPEYQNNLPMQILIHPVWWMNSGNTPDEIFNRIKYKKKNEFEQYIGSNIRL